MASNIILIGFMGSGKSSLARLLSQRLNRPMVSTDAVIEQRQGLKVSQIFAQGGEARFRELEAQIVKELAALTDVIIDCGGGVVLNPENVKVLKSSGKIFFLHTDPEVLYNRLKLDQTRPLLQVADPLSEIKRLLAQRLPLYSQAADMTVDANDPSLLPPLNEILKVINP